MADGAGGSRKCTPSAGAANITLSEAEKRRFERNGFLVRESQDWFEDTIDTIVSDLVDLYGPTSHEDNVVYNPRRIIDAWRINPEVRAMATDPRILAILEELYGRRPLPFQTLNFQVGTEQAAHSDTLHFNSMPAGLMCGVWIASMSGTSKT